MIDEFISSHHTDITCMEGGRLILQQVIAHEMNGAGHVTDAPVIINRPELVTYFVDGHVDVTVVRPWNHDAYRLTIDTPYLHVALTVGEHGEYKLDLNVLDGKGNKRE
jgi:hypothetical protein